MSNYIVAARTPWHKKLFERHTADCPGCWTLVTSPDELAAALRANPAVRYIFFLHWSDKVPPEIVQAYECVCFHMTDVPYGRGGSPLQNLILRGHSDTVLTALRMSDQIDAGPVYLKTPLPLEGSAQQIYLRAAERCWQLIDQIVAQQPLPEPQSGEPLYFKRRSPEQSELPENLSAQAMYDFVRMLDAEGYPKAFLEASGYLLELSDAQLSDDEVVVKAKIRRKP